MVNRPVRIGVQMRPQHGSWQDMRAAWLKAEEMGVDTLYNWDHFFPLYGEPDGLHYECWTVLAAMAEATKRVRFGALVTCNSYRNPNLLADMARTVDQISGGRLILGIGSGWFERDYDEYGYPFKTAPDRLRDLAAALPVIEERMGKLNPGPVNGHIPVLIGGSGEKVTLRLVARHADIWHGHGDPETLGRRGAILEDWCAREERDPAEIERSTTAPADFTETMLDEYVANGVTELLIGSSGPDWDLDGLDRLIAWRDARNSAAS